jgi:hypothetical protein
MSVEDRSDLVMISDLAEIGTANPFTSSYSHTPSGMVIVPGRVIPQDVDYEGGYHAMTDGSARWIGVDKMAQFGSTATGGIQGYWWESPAYPQPSGGNRR